MQIIQPKLIEVSKSEFQIQFIYDNQAFQTQNIERSTPLADVKDIVRAIVDDYELKLDSKNYAKIQSFFSTDIVEL